jgi:uncharacterized protein (DUF1684 family)
VVPLTSISKRCIGLLWLIASVLPLTAWAESSAAAFYQALELHRDNVDYRFRDRILSPLSEADRQVFSGLDYFNGVPELAVRASLEPATDSSTFSMPTFDERTLAFSHYATVDAYIEGQRVKLKAFRRESDEMVRRILLIPFKDTTNDSETYPGGRYIEIDFPLPDPFVLDFNRAANPLCAYDARYACPIPPPENRLSFPIRAGEKRFH